MLSGILLEAMAGKRVQMIVMILSMKI